jgi:uncharacterized protein YaiE (UPF0345 family)
MDTVGKFQQHKPNIEQLRRQYPELGELLSGEFADTPNIYRLEQGTVVSWELYQGKLKNPTYGRIPQGHFEFPTEFTEELIVMKGTLEAKVNDITQILNKGDKIIVPDNTLLKLDVREKVVDYFCQYR